jgi:hypothetical protein
MSASSVAAVGPNPTPFGAASGEIGPSPVTRPRRAAARRPLHPQTTRVSSPADDDVVVHRDVEQSSPPPPAARHPPVIGRRRRIAAGMVVHEDHAAARSAIASRKTSRGCTSDEFSIPARDEHVALEAMLRVEHGHMELLHRQVLQPRPVVGVDHVARGCSGAPDVARFAREPPSQLERRRHDGRAGRPDPVLMRQRGERRLAQPPQRARRIEPAGACATSIAELPRGPLPSSRVSSSTVLSARAPSARRRSRGRWSLRGVHA